LNKKSQFYPKLTPKNTNNFDCSMDNYPSLLGIGSTMAQSEDIKYN
jgi:hypothetical protein